MYQLIIYRKIYTNRYDDQSTNTAFHLEITFEDFVRQVNNYSSNR